jgi:cardiolipin synthase A/B
MLQAKTTTVDGIIAKVGSANPDARSLQGGEDITLVVIGPRIARALDNHFDTDRERSVRIEAQWRTRRSLRHHLAERLVAPLRRVS